LLVSEITKPLLYHIIMEKPIFQLFIAFLYIIMAGRLQTRRQPVYE